MVADRPRGLRPARPRVATFRLDRAPGFGLGGDGPQLDVHALALDGLAE